MITVTGLTKHYGDRTAVDDLTFTVADGYLFTVMNWAPRVKVDLSRWPVLSDYAARIAARPAVQAAMRAEGLIK